jgi:GNAT superfamily N-acetyltransferase
VDTPELLVEALEADDADLEEVVDLLAAQMREHDLPHERARVKAGVLQALRPPTPSRLLVARRGLAVAGVALAHVLPSIEWGGRSLWIEELYVSPLHRQTGVARALMSELERLARDAGASGLDLETIPGHAPAEQLYAGLGFSRLPRQRWARKL